MADTDPFATSHDHPRPGPDLPQTRAQVITLAAEIHEHYREATRAGDGELGALRRKIALMAATRGRAALTAWSTDHRLPDAIRLGARDALGSLPAAPETGPGSG